MVERVDHHCEAGRQALGGAAHGIGYDSRTFGGKDGHAGLVGWQTALDRQRIPGRILGPLGKAGRQLSHLAQRRPIITARQSPADIAQCELHSSPDAKIGAIALSHAIAT